MNEPAEKKGSAGPKTRTGFKPGHRDLGAVLLADEKVLLAAEIHWGIFWKSVLVALLSLALLGTPAFNLGLFFLFVSGVMALIAWMTKHYLALVLTDRRALARWGILNLDYVDIRYSQIESAEIARTLLGRILGYGSVVIAGTGQRVVIVPFVGNAGAFRLKLNEILLRREEKAE